MDSNEPIPRDTLIARTLTEFDMTSGSWLERLLFNHRPVILTLCLALTILFGSVASQVRLQVSYDATIPDKQAFIVNNDHYKKELVGLGNAVRIIVVNPKGSIYEPIYLDKLRRLSDDVFLIPGVDRNQMQSLWTASTRWVAVTQSGLEGGSVIPDDYDGSPSSLSELQSNIARSGQIGRLVAYDAQSSVIYVPLLKNYPDGKPFSYSQFNQSLNNITRKYEADGLSIHVTGFAKIVGDMIAGLQAVFSFFAVAIIITGSMVFLYTRCLRSTLLVMASSLIAVTWQLGLLRLLGLSLDPYSVLVPFLIFAIGMSHGSQKMNGIMQDIGRGNHKLIAARYTFRRLFAAGLAALMADAVGFAVLMTIKIESIRQLAVSAVLGVAVLVITNLILLPILLSYIGVSSRVARRSLRSEELESRNFFWSLLDRFTQRRWAAATLAGAGLLAVGAFVVSTHLQIGDLDSGAPELRAHSQYNQDVAFDNTHYGASSDVFAVMVKTTDGGCANYDTLMRMDALEYELQQLPGVASTNSFASLSRQMSMALDEGNPKWYGLLNNQPMLNYIASNTLPGVHNEQCNLLTLYVYLQNHKAGTLTGVVNAVQSFAKNNDSSQAQFIMAAGNAGVEAATNIVVRQAWWQMLFLVYGAVATLCFFTFRSWRAVLVAVLPLMLTSIMAEALMVILRIGVKVDTLPVIALGVGIGIDYALYILSVTLARLKTGDTLSVAYYRALLFTGKVVMLTGGTLSIAVATWVFSPIKFQADMGLLLAFMFIWNMFGALVMLPALACFLLKRDIDSAHNLSTAPGSSFFRN